MYLKSIILIIFTLFSITTFAFSFRDSIGVETLSGKKVILYKIEPKDNYYSLGRKYGISPKIIMEFNSNAPLNIGTIIRIPTEISSGKTISGKTESPDNATTETLHTVTKKETLYSISAIYGMRMEDLKKLSVPTLVIGAKHDTMDPAHMEKMSKQVQNGSYLFCENGSHMSMYDDQQTYFTGLIKFVKGVNNGEKKVKL